MTGRRCSSQQGRHHAAAPAVAASGASGSRVLTCVSDAVHAEVLQFEAPQGVGMNPSVQRYANAGGADGGGGGEHQSRVRSAVIL